MKIPINLYDQRDSINSSVEILQIDFEVHLMFLRSLIISFFGFALLCFMLARKCWVIAFSTSIVVHDAMQERNDLYRIKQLREQLKTKRQLMQRCFCAGKSIIAALIWISDCRMKSWRQSINQFIDSSAVDGMHNWQVRLATPRDSMVGILFPCFTEGAYLFVFDNLKLVSMILLDVLI